MIWGLDYSVRRDIYLTDKNIGHVTDTIIRLETSAEYPASSCGNILAIKPASPSGMYWLGSSDGSSVSVFCDMNWTCDGVGRGWIKVGGFNNNECPENFTIENINGTENTCVPVTRPGCTSIKYFTNNISYSRVCGEVKGIGIDTPDGFRGHTTDLIDENYVDGISITHGLPNREHIWTLAAEHKDRSHHTCTCNRKKPGFIEDNVCCMEVESMHDYNICECAGCPSIFNSTLPQVTKDVIEIRVCTNQKEKMNK